MVLIAEGLSFGGDEESKAILSPHDISIGDRVIAETGYYALPEAGSPDQHGEVIKRRVRMFLGTVTRIVDAVDEIFFQLQPEEPRGVPNIVTTQSWLTYDRDGHPVMSKTLLFPQSIEE